MQREQPCTARTRLGQIHLTAAILELPMDRGTDIDQGWARRRLGRKRSTFELVYVQLPNWVPRDMEMFWSPLPPQPDQAYAAPAAARAAALASHTRRPTPSPPIQAAIVAFDAVLTATATKIA